MGSKVFSHDVEPLIRKMEEMARSGGAVVYDYLSDSTPVNNPNCSRKPQPRIARQNYIINAVQKKQGRDPFFVSDGEKEIGLRLWAAAVADHARGNARAIIQAAKEIANHLVLWGQQHIEAGISSKGRIKPLKEPERQLQRCKDGRVRSIYVGGFYKKRKDAIYPDQPVLVASGQLLESHKAKAITN